MDIRKLQRAIVDGLEDVKAQHIVVFDTEALSPLFERVIIASGQSNRQTKALAASVRDSVKKAGLQVLRSEGEDNGEWIIVDCGAAVAHIMQPAIRDYYRLEEIWGVKPVGLKKHARKGLVKAEEPARSPASKAGAKKAPAKGAPARRAPAKGAGSKATTAKTGPARKAPAKRAPAKVATAKRAPAKGATTKGAPARKAPAKKAPASKKTSVHRAPRG
jgi:ribosome-associated protein